MKIISQHFLPCSIKYWLLRNEAQTLRRHSYLSSTSVYTRLVFRKDDKKNCQWRCDSRLMSTYTNTERLSLRSIFFSCFSTVLTQNAVLTFTSLLRLLSKTIIKYYVNRWWIEKSWMKNELSVFVSLTTNSLHSKCKCLPNLLRLSFLAFKRHRERDARSIFFSVFLRSPILQ